MGINRGVGSLLSVMELYEQCLIPLAYISLLLWPSLSLFLSGLEGAPSILSVNL